MVRYIPFPHINIVIRNGKIVWVPEDTSTQATSEYIKCKHQKYRKIKATILFIWPAYWSTDISSLYYSDINLFLIDYA